MHFRALLIEGGDALVEGEYFLGDPSLDPGRRVPLQAGVYAALAARGAASARREAFPRPPLLQIRFGALARVISGLEQRTG